mgnify:CR=1 FL=1
MKILLTTSFYPPHHIGGDAMHVKYLAEALAEKGHAVHVLYSLDAYNFKKKEKKVLKKSKVTVHALKSPLGTLEPILNYCFGTQRYTMNYFKKLVKKENFDVVHHHNISLLGYSILKKIGHYINLYTAHDYWLICHKHNMLKYNNLCKEKKCFSCCLKDKKIYQFFRNFQKFKECIRDIDTIIAPSKFMERVLKRRFNNVEVIYNFAPELAHKNTKIKDYFVYAGVLEELKGVINLVRVFSQIDKKLLLIGNGSLENKIRKLKTKNIRLLGWKEHKELFSLISSAQAVIVPSTWPENNPLIALESLLLGTPVIGSDSGGIPEIVKKVDNKLIFKKNNLNQLKNIITNFDRSKYPSEKMRNIYKKYFSQEVFFKKYIELAK